jgi:HAD superfamily hydrolase (TIGR01509 family)
MYEGILFDMDGLLLATEHIYSQVTGEILSRYNLEYTWSLKSRLMGKVEMEAAQYLIEHTGIPMTPQEYLNERNYKQSLLFPDCAVMPGVERVVTHLHKHNVRTAVCTSSHLKNYQLKTIKHGSLFSRFNSIVCGDDPNVKNGKPSPDIFLHGMSLLGISDPSKCIVFEDSPTGVLAGLNAGMNVIWIPDANLEVDSELSSKCLAVLQTMEDFNPGEYGF